MSYQKNVWNKRDKVTSAKMNNIEEGIEYLNNNKLDSEEFYNNVPFKNRDIFSTNELQDETRGDYITFRLSGNVEIIKPIYITVETENGIYKITITDITTATKPVYIVNEEYQTEIMSVNDFLSSCYLGGQQENYLEVNIIGAIKKFGQNYIILTEEAVVIEYEESQSLAQYEI